jgi:seryl-tRNA synthetase
MDGLLMEIKKSKKELLHEANLRIADLEKKLTDEKSYKEMYSKQATEANNQIDELHDFLDGLPDVMPKEKVPYGTNKVSTRLLSWIAKKSNL